MPSQKSFYGTSLPGRHTYRESLYLQSVLNGQFSASDVAAFEQRTTRTVSRGVGAWVEGLTLLCRHLAAGWARARISVCGDAAPSPSLRRPCHCEDPVTGNPANLKLKFGSPAFDIRETQVAAPREVRDEATACEGFGSSLTRRGSGEGREPRVGSHRHATPAW